jgi:EmrB/QacA subfamily drug resistance transporter
MKNKKTIIVVLVVAIGTFMSSLDSSVINLVTPMIKNDFGVSLSTIEWIVTAYLLVISSLLLTFGRISDLYGHKKIYLTGFVIFTMGSLFCGLSATIAMLIIGRIIQAFGAGMLFSTGPAIITNAVPASSRGKAFGISAVAVASGLCTGPIIGGSLATLLGWQSIFFINIPIGIFGIIMVITKIPGDEKKNSLPFDKIGSLMVFIALMFILLPLSISGDYNIPLPVLISLIAAGILIAVMFVVFESKCRYPMLNLKLFKNRVFTAGNVAALFIYMAQFIMAFLAPFYLENLRRFSAIKTGMLYLPMPFATILIAPVSGAISDRCDSRYISTAGTVVMAGGLFMMSFLNSGTSTVYIIISMIITGLGFGMFQTPNNSAIMGNVPQEYRGTASGTLATMRNIGMVMGVAVSGALFSANQNKAVTSFASQGLAVSILKDKAFIYALHVTFMAAVVVALIAMVASLVKGKVKSEKEKVGEER